MEDVNIIACENNLRYSPQKANLIAQLIRGRSAKTSMYNLFSCKRPAAVTFVKLLKSAVANAKNKYNIDEDNLFVSEVWVGKSITLKRFMPRAKGRASSIHKRFSNIKIILKEVKSGTES